MVKQFKKDERGISQLLLILLAVVVLAGVGFAAYKVKNKDDSTNSSTTLSKTDQKAVEKECNDQLKDKDLCRFMANWNGFSKYKVAITNTGSDTSSMTMTVDGANSAMHMEGEAAMDTITVDGTTYTKAGETWWKQPKQETNTSSETTHIDKDQFKFEAPKEDTPESQLPKYTKIGEEACGKLKCFKYKLEDPADTESGSQILWFDTKDYLLRKMETQTAEGKSTMEFSYDNISVKVPSPVKELGPNQYILPGQTEPQTIPGGAFDSN